jgi:hypothetical protein
VRKLEVFVNKYGPVAGPKLFHALQSQAAYAGVSARRKRIIEELTGVRPRPVEKPEPEILPLFPEPETCAASA